MIVFLWNRRELHRRTPDEWKNRFYIVFEGEEGQDAGGLLREWYVIISREIFNPMYALFKVSPGDKVTYTIYEQSQTNPNHLDYFKFVGRVIAKAIYDNKLLECYFARSAVIIPSFKYRDFCDITKFVQSDCLNKMIYQSEMVLKSHNPNRLLLRPILRHKLERSHSRHDTKWWRETINGLKMGVCQSFPPHTSKTYHTFITKLLSQG